MTYSLSERAQSITDMLVANAGVDPLQDRYYSGYLAAVNDFLKLELIEEPQETDENY